MNFSYIKPVSDKLTVTPSLSVSRMYYKKGTNSGKAEVTYVAGLSTSYAINDWLNLSGAANYTAKDGNRADVIEFRGFHQWLWLSTIPFKGKGGVFRLVE